MYLQMPALNGNLPATENIPVVWDSFINRFYSIMFLVPVHIGPSVDAYIDHYRLLMHCLTSIIPDALHMTGCHSIHRESSGPVNFAMIKVNELRREAVVNF
jgi:hypothetical protein